MKYNKLIIFILALLLALPVVLSVEWNLVHYWKGDNNLNNEVAGKPKLIARTAGSEAYGVGILGNAFDCTAGAAADPLNTTLTDLGTVKTFSFWIKTGIGDADKYVLSLQSSNHVDNWFLHYLGNLKQEINFVLNTVTELNYEDINKQLNDGNWHMITYTFDAVNGLNVYINATLVLDTAETAVIDNDFTHIVLCNRYADSAARYTGLIDNVAMFDATWTLADVQTAFNGGLGTEYAATGGSNPLKINVTIISPEDNYGFNASRLATLNHNITINVSINQSNATCYINSSSFDYLNITEENGGCYQESANVSTSCGGTNTGNYRIIDNDWNVPIDNLFDGDWGTFQSDANNVGISTLMINYTKISNFTQLWQVKNGLGTYNITINESCLMMDDNITLIMYSNNFAGEYSNFYCMQPNGDYVLLAKYICATCNNIYEEAIYWRNVSRKTGYYITNNTALVDGKYNYGIRCNDTDPLVYGNDTVAFTIDTTPPDIAPMILLSSNKTFVTNGTLATQINFTDNLEIYSINVTFRNGTNLYLGTNLAQNNYQLNISQIVDETISNWLDIEVCDAHTALEISTINRIDDHNRGLKFVIEDNPFLVQDKWVSIYPKSFSDYANTPISSKSKDRYSFTFNKAIAPLSSETFVVESTEFIDISKLQNYKGHLIISSLNRWIDFENDESTKTEIKRIKDNVVEVTVYGLKSKSITFSSIGELNCVEDRFYFGNLISAVNYTKYVIVAQADKINLSISEPSMLTSISARLWYNNQYYANLTTANFSQVVPAPSPTDESDNITFRWVINANGELFNTSDYQQNVSNVYVDNCSTYKTKTLNFTVRDISTDNTIEGYDFTMSISIWHSSNVTGSTKTFGIESLDVNATNVLCIYPPTISLTSDYSALFTHPSYENLNKQVFSFDLNSTEQFVDMYMVNATTTTGVTITLIDEYSSELPNYLIEVYRYDLVSNNYTFAGSDVTDSNGQVLFYLDVTTDQYKFNILDTDGNLLLVVAKQKLVSTAYTFTLTLGTTSESIAQKLNRLNIKLTADKTLKHFNLTWDEIGYLVDYIQLNVSKGNFSNNFTALYGTVSEDNSGVAGYAIVDSTANVSITYIATVSVYYDGNWYTMGSESLTFMREYDIFGRAESLFMSFIFVGTMAFVGLAVSAEVGLILMTVGLFAMFLLGFYYVGFTALISLAVAIVIIIIKVRR